MSAVENKTPAELDLIFREFRDHASFCRSSLIVETEARALVPMELSPGQIRLNEAIRRQRAKGVPVRLIYLKSRRIHATTGTAAQFFQGTAFQAGVHTAVIAHNDASTQEIFGIYKRFHEQYRAFAGAIRMPPSKVLGDRINYEYGDEPESSFIQVHTAGSVHFGRGFRLSNVHFSEFPYYPQPKRLLAAVLSAVPKLPDTTVVIEGTARTIGDEFHSMWQLSVDPSAGYDWLGLFMGWWEHPSNRMPFGSAEKFGNSLDAEEVELQGRYSLDLRQLAWRRWTIQNDFNGDVVWFRREHPATPEDAFTASSRTRFSIPHIMRMPIQRDPMCGEIVDDLQEHGKVVFLPADRGPLRIWRMPERGRYYAFGADPSGGRDVAQGGASDPDYAAGQIFDRESREQVAVYRARVMPGQFGRELKRLLTFYNMAQIAVEITGVGIATLETLLNEGYPPGLIYHRPVAADQDPVVRSDKIGWETGEVSRQLLLSGLDNVIRQSMLFIHDPITQQELLTFVVNPRGKAEAQGGLHDDLVIALALVVVVMSRMPMPVSPQLVARPEVRKYGQPAQGQNDRRGQNVRLR